MALTHYSAVLTGGLANTKGSYTELVAATPYASSRLHLHLRNTSAARLLFLVDLATGAGGAETVLVANVAGAADADLLAGATVAMDCDVPAGTRLAARCQSPTASANVILTVLVEDRALGGLTAPVTYGADLSLSKGTAIDPGGTINTKSSYVQLSASTAARIDAVALTATVRLGANITAATEWRVDLATGAGGAEVVAIADLVLGASTLGDCVRPSLWRLPVAIPAGTRLAVRASCTRNTAIERELAVTVIGIQEPAASGGGSAGAVAYVG